MNEKKRNIVVWLIVFALSVSYILLGSMYASKSNNLFQDDQVNFVKAKVIKVEDSKKKEYNLNGEKPVESTLTYFQSEIKEGDNKGKVIKVAQETGGITDNREKVIEKGDSIFVSEDPTESYGTSWVFYGYNRIGVLIGFLIGFFVLLLIFGKWKGFNTIVSLGFTCLAVFLVYIPSILSGQNIYMSTMVTCIFIIVMTLLLTHHWSKKTLATILGCVFGAVISAILAVIFDQVLQLTGYVDEHSFFLSYAETGRPIDLVAIIFGAIVVGALGAVMDVAMDISSALSELNIHGKGISFRQMVSSGINIGRDIMGTMANTLVLAYIGSSLSVIALLMLHASSPLELVNRELIVVEILQALIGSTAILLTIPLTSLACAFLYIKVGKEKPVEDWYLGEKEVHDREDKQE